MGLTYEEMKKIVIALLLKKRFELKKEEDKVLFFENKISRTTLVVLIGSRVTPNKLIFALNRLEKKMLEKSNGYIVVPINSLSSVLQDWVKKTGMGLIELSSSGKGKVTIKPKIIKTKPIPFKKFSLLEQNITVLHNDEVDKFLNECNEDEFTEILIGPLFTKIGFENVLIKGHKQRTMEFGQDIKLMRLKLPTNHYLYFAGQVKRGDIKVSNIENVLTQLKLALNKKIFDPYVNKMVSIDHVFLISAGHISEDAQVYLQEQLDTEGRRGVLIIDRRQIIGLCLEHVLPLFTQDKIRRYVEERGGSS